MGTTTIQAQTGQLTHIRLGIADQRGDGRPDFTYQARLFYADSVSPAQIATAGGTITISGLGFRAGNAVSINGVAVRVVSWSANKIVVTAPAMSAVSATANVAVDVTVSDVSTGAASTMSAALTYSGTPIAQMTMKVVTAPSSPSYVGDSTSLPFAVQLLAADGVTPVAGAAVVFSAPAGSVQWTACGSAMCSVRTDANGMASTGVTPLAAGAVTIEAADGALTQLANFTVLAQVASMVLVSAPSGNLPVTLAAATPFSVRDLAANGNGSGYRPITFTVASGSATFSGCFTQTCTVMADGGGYASVYITPGAPGPVTLLATDGDAHQSAAFTAVGNQDVMQIFGRPAANVFPGDSAGHFAILLLHYDGSGDYGKQVVFTTQSGMIIDQCASTTCPAATDGSGYAEISLTAHQTGTYSIQAAFGTVTQTVSVTVVNHTMQLRLVSAPSGNLPVGVTSVVPFSAQLLEDGITPVANYDVGMNGPQDSVLLNSCGLGVCRLNTDSNGMVSTLVTPLKAGFITLSAIFEPATLTASFTAVGPAETMQVLAQPGPTGVMVGDPVNLTIQLIGSDGVTFYPYKLVTFSVAKGSFGFTGCPFTVCTVRTDSTGTVSMSGVAWGAGAVSVQVVDDLTSQTINFMASSKPDVMHLISAPASGGYAGTPVAIPFAVQVLFADGVTTAPGKNVTVSVTSGVAGFAACGGVSSCVLQTGSSGTITTVVTPLSGGSITLTATDGGVSQSATFVALAVPEAMQIVSVPASGTGVGIAASVPFAIRIVAGDGVTPLANRSVTISVTNGLLGVCGLASCVVVSDATGLAATRVTPLAAGVVSLLAADGAVTQATSFTAVVRPDQMNLISAPADGSLVGDVAAAVFAVQVVAGDGVTAAGGRSITLSITSGSARLTACGAASCILITNASGVASSGVIPLAPGTVTLSAAEDAVVQTASFRAAAKADKMSVVSTPGASVFVGAAASSPFSVRLVQNDGVTPVAGAAITFTASTNGAIQFGPCATVSCVVFTDSNGLAATSITGVTAGSMVLMATADPTTGAAGISIPFQVLPNQYNLTASHATTYVEEGVVLRLNLNAAATENGSASPGQTVHWTALQGFVLGASASVTAADGSTAVPAVLGPLSAGAQTTAIACAWTNVCASFTGIGVSAQDLRIAVTSGGQQSATGGAALGAVVVMVTDGSGNPVAAAQVSVYQTVTALDASCSNRGRCPAAPVLLSKTIVMVSGTDGTLTLTPLTVAGVATQTEIAYSVGTQGFATVVLSAQP